MTRHMGHAIPREQPPIPRAAQGAAPPRTDPRLRHLLAAKACVDVAENALIYALLIAVVVQSGSSIHSTLLVVAITVPAILFGIPAGIVADRLPKRLVLATALVVRVALAAGLVIVANDLRWLYALVFAFAAVGQVFPPTWIALLPLFAGVERLSRAHALLNLAQLGGQVFGVVALAPLLLKLLDARAVYVASGLFLIGALVFVLRLGTVPRPRADAPPTQTRARGGIRGLFAGWAAIRADTRMYIAAMQLTVVAALLKSLIVLFPYYTQQVLRLAPENTVYVAAPAAIGAAVGLALAPALGALGRARVASAGFGIFLVALGAMALATTLQPFVADTLHLGFTGLARRLHVLPAVPTAMLFAVPLGFGIAVHLVAARTVLNERAPEAMQGRIFATLNALGNLATLPPLFLAGGLAAVIGARAVMLLAALVAFALPIILHVRRAHRTVQEPLPAAS
jgi:MFS family permease